MGHHTEGAKALKVSRKLRRGSPAGSRASIIERPKFGESINRLRASSARIIEPNSLLDQRAGSSTSEERCLFSHCSG